MTRSWCRNGIIKSIGYQELITMNDIIKMSRLWSAHYDEWYHKMYRLWLARDDPMVSFCGSMKSIGYEALITMNGIIKCIVYEALADDPMVS
jgi:hypothetical protein